MDNPIQRYQNVIRAQSLLLEGRPARIEREILLRGEPMGTLVVEAVQEGVSQLQFCDYKQLRVDKKGETKHG